MTRCLFLAPHNDDETLFGAFTLLAWRPDVIVCYRSEKQDVHGIRPVTREMETGMALRLLTGDFHAYLQATVPDTASDAVATAALRPIFEDAHEILGTSRDPYDLVFAPAVEDGGHEQHSLIGDLALRVFGERVVPYLTYRRGFGRSTSSVEVPFMPDWPALKLAAMSFYRSQIALPSTAPWFIDHGLREFYAEGTKVGMFEQESPGFVEAREESPAPITAEHLRTML